MTYRRLVFTSACLLAASAAQAGETLTYTYDVHGRLTKVSRSGTVNSGVYSVYEHDKADNRVTVTVAGVTAAAAVAGDPTTVPEAGVINGSSASPDTSAPEPAPEMEQSTSSTEATAPQ